MIEKLKTPEDWLPSVNSDKEIRKKINELIDTVNEIMTCRFDCDDGVPTEESAEIPDTEYITIKEDDVYVGGKPATEYNGKKIYNRYFCPAYFKEARDIIREEYGYELLEIHCLQSSTDGEYARTGNPVADKNGTKCWVRCVYKNENGTPAASLWVFYNAYSSASGCANYCAYNCGNSVRYYSDMRSGLFGSVRSDVKKD